MADNVECSICTDFYSAVPNDFFVVTECGHMFHNKCINTALSKNSKCPVCRKSINDASSLRSVHGVHPSRIPRKFTIVTLGDSGVGKTAIVNRFTYGSFDCGFRSTVAFELKKARIEVGGDVVDLSIWDTCGQEHFKSITPQYIRRSHGIIIAYDSSCLNTLNNVPEWLNLANLHAPEAEKVLIGCKSDLEQCTLCRRDGKCRKPTQQEVENVASSLGLFHFITSAKSMYCVDVAFRTLASSIMENYPLLRHTNNDGSTITLHDPPPGPGDDDFCGLERLWRKLWGIAASETNQQ